MAKPSVNISLEDLTKFADQYIEECVNNTVEVVASSGKVVKRRDRHIPTVEYFLHIWLPMISGIVKPISRITYYNWLHQDKTELKFNTIKKIDDKFKALAIDIVANEQKGIFYAKNRLGMTDRTDIKEDSKQEIVVKYANGDNPTKTT
jgi:uncharacterized protein YaaR (DUF327 family)